MEIIDTETYEIGFTFSQVKDGSGRIVHNGTTRIGDRLVFSGIPEMMYKQRNIKVVDLDSNNWFFDYNPYIVRNAKVKNTIPLQLLADQSTHHTYLKNLPIFLSVADKYCQYFGLKSTIRHPRLYKYEDIQRKPAKVVLASQGALQGFMMNETMPRILPDHVMEQILYNYKGFEIVQVGLSTDKKIEGVIDRRGLPNIWDTVKEIAESMVVIAPSCGVTWIAAAYPHINNKVVLCEYNEVAMDSYVPRIVTNHHQQWSDQHMNLYNIYDFDIGVTTSYKNI
jgi:hypothetical protein